MRGTSDFSQERKDQGPVCNLWMVVWLVLSKRAAMQPLNF